MILLVATVALIFGSSSCKDVLDVKRDFSFTYELKVDSDKNDYYSADLIDLTEEVSVIKDYGDNIKEIDIKDISLWIRNHQGPTDHAIVQTEVIVANADGSGQTVVSFIENQAIEPIIQNPISLDLNDEGVNKLNRLIRQSPHTLQIILSGELNKSPANFTAVFEFEGRMVANPL
ncbi:MAG: hypothetical protein EA411_03810 [Saprospirales bacterium]|nr:MAG: hypothetical protein EA411_03810 [Saprospirales bacterium]